MKNNSFLSSLTSIQLSAELTLILIPVLKDNYIWLLHNKQEAIVIDPSVALPVLNQLRELHHLRLSQIWITHHHNDHLDGALELSLATNAQIVAPARELKIIESKMKSAHLQPIKAVQSGDVLDVFDWRFEVLDVPGHTTGHKFHHIKNLPNF